MFFDGRRARRPLPGLSTCCGCARVLVCGATACVMCGARGSGIPSPVRGRVAWLGCQTPRRARAQNRSYEASRGHILSRCARSSSSN